MNKILHLSLLLPLLTCNAIRGATPVPVDRVGVVALLAGGAPAGEVALLIQQRGLSFLSTPAFLNLVKRAESPHDPDAVSLLQVIAAARQVNPLAAQSSQEPQIIEHLARGAKLDWNVFPPNPQKYAAAESEMRQALQLNSRNPLLHFALGKVYWDEGKFDAAVAELRQTVLTMPTLSVAHVNLGSALAQKGDFKDAIAELQTAVQLAPDSPYARGTLAVVLAKNHEPTEAAEELRDGLRILPNNASLHNSLGTILYESGYTVGAIAEYQETIRLGSKDPRSFTDLATALHRKGDLMGEIAALQEGVRADPNSVRLHYGLAEALINRNDLSGAQMELNEVIRLRPDYAVAHSELGYVLVKQHHVDEAIGQYREAIQLDPKFATAHSNLGAAYWRKHDNKDGYKEVLIAHELAPNDPAITMQFGKLPEKWKRKATQPVQISRPARAPIGEPPKPDFIYYVDEVANSLVPLEAEIPTLGGRAGPFRTSAYSSVIGERSPVRFKTDSKWEFLIRPTSPTQILSFRLERFDSKGGARTVRFGSKVNITSNPAKPGLLNFKAALQGNSFELTIPYDLIPGEYGFFVSAKGGGWGMFCFGVDHP